MKIDWLPRAMGDFYEIIDYIADDDPAAAIEQGDEIEQQVTGLSANHRMGRPGRVKGTRELVVVRTPYIAVYRPKKGTLQILRILHGARLWPDRY